jgi:hypothetical protein
MLSTSPFFRKASRIAVRLVHWRVLFPLILYEKGRLSAVTFPCSHLILLHMKVSGESFFRAIHASEESNHSLGLILPKQDKVREGTAGQMAKIWAKSQRWGSLRLWLCNLVPPS